MLLHCDDRPLVVVRNFDFVDICAGKARIAKWALAAGLTGAAIDIEYGQHMDINTDEGLALAIVCVLRVVVGGLVFLACKCSSWIWMCRASTKRSHENPQGNPKAPSVIEGNKLNLRCSLLCRLAHSCLSRWVVEQPDSSLFFDTDSMKAVRAHCQAHLVQFSMASFGHVARKGTYLLGTVDWLEELANAGASSAAPSGKPGAELGNTGTSRAASSGKPKKGSGKGKGKAKAKAALVKVARGADGKRTFTGDKVALKDSQVYPARFALCVVQLHWRQRFNR